MKNKKIKMFDIAIIIGSVITVGKFWDLFKSKERRLLEFQGELAKQLQEANFKQMELNIQEAKHRSIFVAGWWPFIGWVCGTAFLYQFILRDFLVLVLDKTELPNLDLSQLMTILTTMLVMVALRTYEKRKIKLCRYIRIEKATKEILIAFQIVIMELSRRKITLPVDNNYTVLKSDSHSYTQSHFKLSPTGSVIFLKGGIYLVNSIFLVSNWSNTNVNYVFCLSLGHILSQGYLFNDSTNTVNKFSFSGSILLEVKRGNSVNVQFSVDKKFNLVCLVFNLSIIKINKNAI